MASKDVDVVLPEDQLDELEKQWAKEYEEDYLYERE